MRSDFEVSHECDVVKTAAQEKIKDFSRVEKHEQYGPSLDKNAKLRRNIGWRVKRRMQMNFFIILFVVTLIIGLIIGFSWVETMVIIWIGSLLGLTVPFNICFFIVLVWNLLFFGGGTRSSSKD